jgi:hypothetical protein
MGLTPEETWGGDDPPRIDKPSRQGAAQEKDPLAHERPAPQLPSTPREKLFPNNLLSSRDAQVSLIIFLLTVCTLLLAWNTFKPAQKWEYKIEAVPDIGFETRINNLGNEGWELVFARRASTGKELGDKTEFSYEMIFKRPAK